MAAIASKGLPRSCGGSTGKDGSHERESWAGWERSKAPREKTVMTQGKTGDKRGSKTVQQRDGNARYLARLNGVITARANLLGLNAPTKITNRSERLSRLRRRVMQQLIKMDLSNDELDALRKLACAA